MLEKSRFPEFEAALERFLTEDRGAVMLNVPISRIKTSAIELVKAAQLRESALAMHKEEFNSKYEKAMAEIERIRSERQNEFHRINEASERTYSELMPEIKDYWHSLGQAADEAIDAYSIASTDELKGNAVQETQEAMTRAVKEAISRVSQNIAERIQFTIDNALANEAERLSGFESRFYEATEGIQNLFVTVDVDGGTGADVAVSVVASSLLGYGLGGIYLGYKQAGWKGALLGGGTSFAGTVAASMGAGVLLTALSIPLTWPVLLVAGIGAAAVGAFTGKWALGKAFSKDKIEKFKSSFKDAVHNELVRMKAADDISENVRAQIEAAFNALKEKIKTETENILNDTQNQLTQIKVELAQADSMDEREKDELRHMLTELDAICARADGISRELTLVLSRQEAEG